MTRATLELDGVSYDVRCVAVKGAHGTPDAWTVTVDGAEVPVRLLRNGAGLLVEAGGKSFHLELPHGSGPGGTPAAEPGTCRIDGRAHSWRVAELAAVDDDEAGGSHGAKVRAPMNGKLERLAVAVGQTVARGDLLFVLEAMKMQNEVRSPTAGKVTAVHGSPGAVVDPSVVVVEIEKAASGPSA